MINETGRGKKLQHLGREAKCFLPGSNMSYTLPSASTGGTGQSEHYRRLCPKQLCMADPIVHRTLGNESFLLAWGAFMGCIYNKRRILFFVTQERIFPYLSLNFYQRYKVTEARNARSKYVCCWTCWERFVFMLSLANEILVLDWHY